MSQWAPLYLFCIVEFLPKLQLHSKGSVQPPNIHPPNGMHWLQLGPSLEMHVYQSYLINQWLIWYTIQYYMNKSLDLYISHERSLNLRNHKLVSYKLNLMNCFETIQPNKLEHHLYYNCKWKFSKDLMITFEFGIGILRLKKNLLSSFLLGKGQR